MMGSSNRLWVLCAGALPLLLALLTAGCLDTEASGPGQYCRRISDCRFGLVCVLRECVEQRRPEAGPGDGAGLDAAPDAEAPDAVADAVADATLDAVADAAPDAMVDAAPDTMADAAPDAVVDAAPDAVPDAMPDAVPDAMPDAVSDAMPDAVSDAMPDAVSDAMVCTPGVIAPPAGAGCSATTATCVAACETGGSTCISDCIAADPAPAACHACLGQSHAACANVDGCLSLWNDFDCCVQDRCPADCSCATTSCGSSRRDWEACAARVGALACESELRGCFAGPAVSLTAAAMGLSLYLFDTRDACDY